MSSLNIDNKLTGQKTTFRKSWKILRANIQFRITWRIVLLVSAIYLIPAFFLGIPFFLMSVGIFHIFLKLSTFWAPARRILYLILGISENGFPFSTDKVSTWQIIYRSVLSLPWLAMILYGVWMLIKYGFKELNPIYWVLSH
jgi:hypothetical protein